MLLPLMRKERERNIIEILFFAIHNTVYCGHKMYCGLSMLLLLILLPCVAGYICSSDMLLLLFSDGWFENEIKQLGSLMCCVQ